MSANKLELPKLASNKQASNNTLKNTKHSKSKTIRIKSVSVRKTKNDIKKFKIMFESFFAEHDKLEKYKVSSMVLDPYITANKFENDKLKWLEVFKSARHLLYLDQFITFNYYTVLAPEMSIADFITEYYYDLYVARKIKTKGKLVLQIIWEYRNAIYKELNELIKKFNMTNNRNNIRDVSIIQSHGQIDISTSYCIVPENVIIAFTAPFNKYQNIRTNPTKIVNSIFDILQWEIHKNSNFLNNPACSFRSDNCLQNTVYYYPGQIIPNYDLTFNSSERMEKDFGFYTSKETNNKELIFEQVDVSSYQTSICEMFNKSMEAIENKIIYINCCRKCDNVLDHITTEFLYRYEHIISFINMIPCNKFDDTNWELCSREDLRSIKHIEDRYEPQLSANNTTKHLFFDSALSYAFKQNSIKKSMYLDDDPVKWSLTLNILNEASDDDKLEYTLQIYTYLNNMISRKPELYSKRLVDLFTNIHDNPAPGFMRFFEKQKPISIMADLDNDYVPEDYQKKITELVKPFLKL
jgi:hypothetical protein